MYLRRRTCVSHREELFRILAVARPAQRLGRRKLEVERGVLAMRLDVSVAPCASRGGFGGVLFVVNSNEKAACTLVCAPSCLLR